MIPVVVTGASGRMGSQLVRQIRAAEGLAVAAATERPGHVEGTDAGVLAGLGPIGVPIRGRLEDALAASKAQVVVDFTSHEASARHAEICAERGAALVVGSTGFTPETRARVAAAAQRVPIVLSPNMSVGVNVLFALVRDAAATLGDGFDVEIVEMHHRKKKDAPSGTAVRLAEIAAQALGRDVAKDLVFARHGMVGERAAREIGVQTLRGGDVVGEHTVHFVADGERIELTHRATSREQFASGAVRAIRWIAGRAPGLYDMADVLGLGKGR
jgi:4-hydroxy-tetrahydrodipicolinate reductase